MPLNKKALAILSAAHLVTDVNQGSLPALLPFFKEALSLSYTTSGVILLAANLTSSIIQPAFGHLSDRHPFGWFLPLAPFIACLGLALTGLVSNYPLLLVCVIITGIGIASFWTALLVAVVLGLLNVTVGLVLKVLTFPLTLVTFGLFLLVINALMFWAASFVKGFHVGGFWAAFFGALVVTVINLIGKQLLKD